MNCGVCILLLRALRRGGGGGGESEDDMTEMTSSGSESQFLLRRGGREGGGREGKTRRVMGGRGVFLTPDVEVQVTRNVGRCPRIVATESFAKRRSLTV